MMLKKASQKRTQRWFKQWSRKSYAVFSSIGSVVHVGRLKVDVSAQAELKSSSKTIFSKSEHNTENTFELTEKSELPLWDALIELLIIKPFKHQATTNAVIPCKSFKFKGATLHNHINCTSHKEVQFFFTILTSKS